MNIKPIIKKLQTALLYEYNLPIKINNTQFYSQDQHRIITMTSLTVRITYYSKKYESWKEKDYELIKSCSAIDILDCMVDIYKAVSGGT